MEYLAVFSPFPPLHQLNGLPLPWFHIYNIKHNLLRKKHLITAAVIHGCGHVKLLFFCACSLQWRQTYVHHVTYIITLTFSCVYCTCTCTSCCLQASFQILLSHICSVHHSDLDHSLQYSLQFLLCTVAKNSTKFEATTTIITIILHNCIGYTIWHLLYWQSA